jgi:predicted GNAT family N-acyltransferase
MIEVRHIIDPADWQAALRIRREVFVDEQRVPAEAEYDQYEATSRHFLARAGDDVAGTARWRFTDKGVKLERFAVRRPFRGRQVGSALVEAVLADVRQHPQYHGEPIYLHAQLTAMPLYTKFGFRPVGDRFVECDIEHYQMVIGQ